MRQWQDLNFLVCAGIYYEEVDSGTALDAKWCEEKLTPLMHSMAGRLELVVIDSISAGMSSLNGNANFTSNVSGPMNALQKLAVELDTAVVLVHHLKVKPVYGVKPYLGFNLADQTSSLTLGSLVGAEVSFGKSHALS